MNLCMTLTFVVGKGVHNIYGDIKRKHAIKREEERHRLEQDGHESSSSATLGCTSHQRGRSGRKRAKQGNLHCHHQWCRREHPQHEHHNHQSQQHPDQPRLDLGISSEARASAEARACHSRHHQQARDLGVAPPLHSGANLPGTHREESDVPPMYDSTAPRLPVYDVIARASPDETETRTRRHQQAQWPHCPTHTDPTSEVGNFEIPHERLAEHMERCPDRSTSNPRTLHPPRLGDTAVEDDAFPSRTMNVGTFGPSSTACQLPPPYG
ncbi:hypothetical protein BDZ97DRAFT_1752631 [Flammula alnicola]|nr:hypothetical protein BDZ97DRAFT_1752631 [Flammula alnicola]